MPNKQLRFAVINPNHNLVYPISILLQINSFSYRKDQHILMFAQNHQKIQQIRFIAQLWHFQKQQMMRRALSTNQLIYQKHGNPAEVFLWNFKIPNFSGFERCHQAVGSQRDAAKASAGPVESSAHQSGGHQPNSRRFFEQI